MDKVKVVDNFLPDYDVEILLNSAKEAGFDTWLPNEGEVGSSIYDGMGFWGEHSLALRALILAENRMVLPNSMFFRITNEGMEKAYIHSDREAGAHTCVLYLTEHEQPSGTAFFRHKPTGLTEMPSFAEMRDMGILAELKADMVSRDPDKWEMVGYVEGKLNRAVIFDAPLFHSRFPLEGIGEDIDSGRAVWVSHFYHIDSSGDLI